MIEINGKEFYTAQDICPILQMAYSSVIHLLQEYNIPKYKNKYYLTQEQLDSILHRDNQYIKQLNLKEHFEKNRYKDKLN